MGQSSPVTPEPIPEGPDPVPTAPGPGPADGPGKDPGRNPNRRHVLRAAGALPVVLAARRSAAAGARGAPPNLLVLVADDTSRLCIGAHGNPDATTPATDALARQGCRFDRAYTTVGLCVPSRASMYTGLWPAAHGADGFDPVRADVDTCPALLNPAGVATGLIGKVHVEPEQRFPFEYLATGPAYKKQRDPTAYAGAFGEFLARAGERPFACFVNFMDPHRPFGHGKDESEGGAPRLHDPERVGLFPFLWDTPETRADLARYYDALARMDATLARLLDLLEASGRAQDTLVVFTADNGMPFPFAKATLYEAGINLPFVVRWPGVVAPGTSSDAVVGLVDLLPTALDSFGLEGPELQGHSLLPLLRGEVDSVREDWFAMHTSQIVGEDYPSRALRRGKWKYVRNLEPEARFRMSGFNRSRTWRSWRALAEGEAPPAGLEEHMRRLLERPAEELYDLDADPFEQRELLGDPEWSRGPERARVLEALRAYLRERMEAVGDRDGLSALER